MVREDLVTESISNKNKKSIQPRIIPSPHGLPAGFKFETYLENSIS